MHFERVEPNVEIGKLRDRIEIYTREYITDGLNNTIQDWILKQKTWAYVDWHGELWIKTKGDIDMANKFFNEQTCFIYTRWKPWLDITCRVRFNDFWYIIEGIDNFKNKNRIVKLRCIRQQGVGTDGNDIPF